MNILDLFLQPVNIFLTGYLSEGFWPIIKIRSHHHGAFREKGRKAAAFVCVELPVPFIFQIQRRRRFALMSAPVSYKLYLHSPIFTSTMLMYQTHI